MSRTVFIRNLADLPKGMGFKVINGDETIDVIRTDDNQVVMFVPAVAFLCQMVGFAGLMQSALNETNGLTRQPG